jgi:myo-inositol catabolism protein IolS
MSPARSPKKGRSRPAAAPSQIGTLPLPGTAKAHPELGVGLWARGRWSAEDEARTKASIGRAYERGFRWFDTAEVYGSGRSERVLGDVLARTTTGGADTFLVTKVSWEHLRPAQVRASLVNSLERLGRPAVDLYLIHGPDPKVPLAETMPALEALWKEKKVGAIGVSNFGVEELEESARHLSETRVVVNQVKYNLFDREDADAVRAYCADHDILIEAYTPLARGLLHGRYLEGKRVPADVRRFSERLFAPERLPEVLARARAVRDLAEEAGVPMASIALHWLRKQGAAPIVGVSTPAQVDANLDAWSQRPSDAILERADAIARGGRA